MHSEPQTDFSTCCGACGLKAHAVNRQTPILAPACNTHTLLALLVLFCLESHSLFTTELSFAMFHKMIHPAWCAARQVGFWILQSLCPC